MSRHLPRLTPPQLELVRATLAASSLSDRAKRQIMAMIETASNPDAEAPEVVIAALPAERRDNVNETVSALNGFTKRMTARARAELLALDNFDALVDEADGAE